MISFLKKNPSTIIALLPAFAVAVALNYEMGYLLYFNVPNYFLKITLEGISRACTILFSLAVFAGSLFFMISGIFRISKKDWLITLRLVVYPILYGLFFLAFRVEIVAILLAIGILSEIFMYIALKRGHKYSYNLYYKVIIPPFLIINFFLASSLAIGNIVAEHRPLYFASNISDESMDIVVRKYDDSCILVEYDRIKRSYLNNFYYDKCPSNLRLIKTSDNYLKL